MAPSAPHAANGDIASTLNYALGNLGGRQKSWMMNAAAAPYTAHSTPFPSAPQVQRRGRPPKQRAPLPGTHTRPQAAFPLHSPPEPQADRQTSSNSTSPHLANVLFHAPHAEHDNNPSDFAILPSPTPSNENLAPNLADSNVDSQPVDPAAFASDPPLTAVFMDATQRQGHTGTHAPMWGNAQGLHEVISGTALVQERPQPAEGTAHVPASQPWPASLREPPRTLSHEANQPTFPILAEAVHFPGALPSPPIPQPIAWYSTQDCLHILDQFCDSFSAASTQPHDSARLIVLRYATETQDWAYLSMHQFYCMQTSSSLPGALLQELRAQPNVQQALNQLAEVLDINENLSPAVVHFFSNYPYPYSVIRGRWPVASMQQWRMIKFFIERSSRYKYLKLGCQQQRLPPLARELQHEHGIVSPLFQRLLFTYVLRSIWGSAPQNKAQAQIEYDATAIFRQSQLELHQQQTPSDLGAYQLELPAWTAQLRTLVNAFTSMLTAPQSSMVQQLQHPHLQTQHPPHRQLDRQMTMQQPPAAEMHLRRPVHNRLVLPSQTMSPNPRDVIHQPRTLVPLLPARGWLQPLQRVPDPLRFALHQAHLRSPVLKAELPSSSSLYYFLQNHVKLVRLSQGGQGLEKLTFTLAPETLSLLPKTACDAPGGAGVKLIRDCSKSLRLRCIRWPSADLPTEHAWATADTSWIPYSYFSLNGKSLEQRRKIHYGKDLPIDLTGLVKEGENVVEIAIMAGSSDTIHRNYLISIEYLGIQSHELIKQHCFNHRVPSAQVLDSIKKRLSSTSNDDDDIALVPSDLPIQLFDPFSAAAICNIPVRSKACLHDECFDLDTFLSTRTRKGDVSVVDQWLCPICRADARPSQLVVDGFLELVRTQLEARGLSHTRAIVVHPDGSWEAKAEVRDPNGVSDDEPKPATRQGSRAPTYVDIIDLSD